MNRSLARRSRSKRIATSLLIGGVLLLSTDSVVVGQKKGKKQDPPAPEDLMIVDCLLPGKIRRLGRRTQTVTPRRPIRTAAVECRIRGGEYTAFDRADFDTALGVWMGEAQSGSAEAQYYVGQIWERGLGRAPDYGRAAQWYGKAAAQDYGPAQVHLAYLYENGLGVEPDPAEALDLYRAAADLPDELMVIESAEYEALGQLRIEAERAQAEAVLLQAELAEVQSSLESARQVGDRENAEAQRLREEVQRLEAELAERNQAASDSRERVAALEAQLPGLGDRGAGDPTAGSGSSIDDLDFGGYHALVVGVQNYQYLPELESAIEEAESVATLLEQRYGFEVQRLYDATRYQILSSLNELREKLDGDQNLVIYFAGRSASQGDRSWWQPADAEPDSRANWLSSRVVSDQVDVIPARHVLVVADAAYSGVLTRSSVPLLPQEPEDPRRLTYIEQMLDKRSRLLLATGDGQQRETADLRLTRAFVDVLEENTRVLEASSVYLRLLSTIGTQENGTAVVFAPIRWVRTDAGSDFFFVPAGR